MSIGQNINSASEAPANLLDMKGGGTPDVVSNPLQNQYISSIDRNSTLGGLLSETDDAVAEGLHETDDGIAAFGGSKALPVTMTSHSAAENTGLISRENGKEYLNFPPTQDIYNTAAAKEVFNRLFDAKKTNAAA